VDVGATRWGATRGFRWGEGSMQRMFRVVGLVGIALEEQG
jgi:hypothetical protein